MNPDYEINESLFDSQKKSVDPCSLTSTLVFGQVSSTVLSVAASYLSSLLETYELMMS